MLYHAQVRKHTGGATDLRMSPSLGVPGVDVCKDDPRRSRPLRGPKDEHTSLLHGDLATAVAAFDRRRQRLEADGTATLVARQRVGLKKFLAAHVHVATVEDRAKWLQGFAQPGLAAWSFSVQHVPGATPVEVLSGLLAGRRVPPPRATWWVKATMLAAESRRLAPPAWISPLPGAARATLMYSHDGQRAMRQRCKAWTQALVGTITSCLAEVKAAIQDGLAAAAPRAAAAAPPKPAATTKNGKRPRAASFADDTSTLGIPDAKLSRGSATRRRRASASHPHPHPHTVPPVAAPPPAPLPPAPAARPRGRSIDSAGSGGGGGGPPPPPTSRVQAVAQRLSRLSQGWLYATRLARWQADKGLVCLQGLMDAMVALVEPPTVADDAPTAVHVGKFSVWYPVSLAAAAAAQYLNGILQHGRVLAGFVRQALATLQVVHRVEAALRRQGVTIRTGGAPGKGGGTNALGDLRHLLYCCLQHILVVAPGAVVWSSPPAPTHTPPLVTWGLLCVVRAVTVVSPAAHAAPARRNCKQVLHRALANAEVVGGGTSWLPPGDASPALAGDATPDHDAVYGTQPLGCLPTWCVPFPMASGLAATAAVVQWVADTGTPGATAAAVDVLAAHGVWLAHHAAWLQFLDDGRCPCGGIGGGGATEPGGTCPLCVYLRVGEEAPAPAPPPATPPLQAGVVGALRGVVPPSPEGLAAVRALLAALVARRLVDAGGLSDGGECPAAPLAPPGTWFECAAARHAYYARGAGGDVDDTPVEPCGVCGGVPAAPAQPSPTDCMCVRLVVAAMERFLLAPGGSPPPGLPTPPGTCCSQAGCRLVGDVVWLALREVLERCPPHTPSTLAVYLVAKHVCRDAGVAAAVWDGALACVVDGEPGVLPDVALRLAGAAALGAGGVSTGTDADVGRLVAAVQACAACEAPDSWTACRLLVCARLVCGRREAMGALCTALAAVGGAPTWEGVAPTQALPGLAAMTVGGDDMAAAMLDALCTALAAGGDPAHAALVGVAHPPDTHPCRWRMPPPPPGFPPRVAPQVAAVLRRATLADTKDVSVQPLRVVIRGRAGEEDMVLLADPWMLLEGVDDSLPVDAGLAMEAQPPPSTSS